MLHVDLVAGDVCARWVQGRRDPFAQCAIADSNPDPRSEGHCHHVRSADQHGNARQHGYQLANLDLRANEYHGSDTHPC